MSDGEKHFVVKGHISKIYTKNECRSQVLIQAYPEFATSRTTKPHPILLGYLTVSEKPMTKILGKKNSKVCKINFDFFPGTNFSQYRVWIMKLKTKQFEQRPI